MGKVVWGARVEGFAGGATGSDVTAGVFLLFFFLSSFSFSLGHFEKLTL
jgi:hypothetical protein